MTTQDHTTKAPNGAGSFCIPRAAFNALLDARATAYEVCTYLVLARFTDSSGRFSTASISAVNRHTGANKVKGGTVDRAHQRLLTIRAKTTKQVSNGRTGKSHAMIEQVIDLGPILYTRDAWHQATGEIFPDGPHERAKVLHVLPDFEELQEDRIWFGNNLVTGVKTFGQPLKSLKNAGDVAARLLLSLYAVNDMETWGGIRPVGDRFGLWLQYEPVSTDVHLHGGVRLMRAKRGSIVGPGVMFSRVCPYSQAAADKWWESHDAAGGPVWRALESLESAGFVYEMVLVLNRNANKSKFSSGSEYSGIPEDAEPLYELDCRSQHGYKPEGEEGIGWATATTAGELNHSVALSGGQLDGTYAAIVSKGHPAMIVGIYRLRFRVVNPKNAGVKGAWAGIQQRNKEALELVNRTRATYKLPPITPPSANIKQQPVAPADLDYVDPIPF